MIKKVYLAKGSKQDYLFYLEQLGYDRFALTDNSLDCIDDKQKQVAHIDNSDLINALAELFPMKYVIYSLDELKAELNHQDERTMS